MERDVIELFQKGMEMMQVGEYQIAEQLFQESARSYNGYTAQDLSSGA